MLALTVAEKALLETHPHSIKLYLAILRPATVFTAQVNDGDIAQGERVITYDNVSSGEIGAVVAGMTMYVGSTAAAYDLGKVRVRSTDGGALTITVAENSDVQWADGAYLTVKENYEFWSIFPRITSSSGTVTFYKDYDVVYSYQTEREPPVAVMGPPECKFLDSDTVTVSFVSEYSYSVAASKSIASYSWSLPSATPNTSSTNGTAASPLQVTYDTAKGHEPYWVALEVTDSAPNATAHTGRRPVFIFERTGSNAPYTNFELLNLTGDYSAGGWTMDIRVFESATESEFPEDTMVVLFAEEWYGSTKQSIGGYPYRQHIKFVGNIMRESVHEEYAADGQRYVEFTAQTIDGMMKARECFALTVEDDSTPGYWLEMRGLNVDRAAYYLFKWHSTLYDIADVYKIGDTRPISAQDFPAGSIYRMGDDYLASAVFARCIVSKYGGVWLQKDPQMQLAAERTSVLTWHELDKADRRAMIDIPRETIGRIKYVELGGVRYNSSTGKATAMLSEAPGNAPQQDGAEERLTGIVLDTQANANELSGLVLAERNNLYRDVTIPLNGNHSYADIAPQMWLQMDLAAADNKRGLTWTNRKLLPRQVRLLYDPSAASMNVDVVADAESTGVDGTTSEIPTVPPDEEVPEPIGPAWPPLPPDPTEDPKWAVIFDDTNGCYWTSDADNASPTWTARNTGLSDTAFLCGGILRGWQSIQGTSDPENVMMFGGGEGWFAVTEDAAVSWIDRTPQTISTITWAGDDDPNISNLMFIDCDSPNDDTETFYVIGYGINSVGGQVMFLLSTGDFGLTYDGIYKTATDGGGSGYGWWGPDSTDAWDGYTEANIWQTGCPSGPGAYVFSEKTEVTNAGEGTDEDGTYITWTLTQYPCSTLNEDYWKMASFVADFGTTISDVTGIRIKSGHISGAWSSGDAATNLGNFYATTYNSSIEVNNPYGINISTSPTGWTAYTDEDAWIYRKSTMAWRTLYSNVSQPLSFRYLYHYCSLFTNYLSPNYPAGDGSQCGVDTIEVYGDREPVVGGGTVTPMGIAIDLEDGSRIYVTYQDGGTGCFLGIFDTDLTETRNYNLTTNHNVGGAVYPRCVWQPSVTDFGDYVYIFGVNDTGAFVAESTDAGVTVTDRSGASLSTDTSVTALFAKGDGAGGATVFTAFTSDLNVWQEDGAWSWSDVGDAPFSPYHRGISMSYDTELTGLVANSAAGAAMAETAPDPYTIYADRTGDLPIDGGIVFAEWITP